MVDVITTRVQEAYVGWRQRSLTLDLEVPPDAAGGQRLTQAALRRAALHHKRRQLMDRGAERMERDRSLFQIKESPTKVVPVALTRPFMGLSCSKCVPESRISLVNEASRKLSIINVLHLGSNYSNNNGFISRTFCDFVQAYKATKFDYQQVSETVMHDERLLQALEKITQETLEKQEAEAKNPTGKEKVKILSSAAIYKNNEKRARSILVNMRSTISDLLLRITSWTLYKLLPYFVNSVAASPAQMEMLKRAGDSGLPLIFIPLHRSHLDYILVSFILLNYNIRSPLVAAGDNLKIPFFGWLLRGLGAFYIKRRLDTNGSEKDIVYRAALHTYMMHCLRARHNIEFFIEGGRSRTGKPQLPKGGILSVIVDAFLDGTIEDALLVPVSMNYEKLVDGNFVREQMGMPKKMETFGAATKAIWKTLNSHFGNLRIDFNQPFSMRELVRSFQTSSKFRTPMTWSSKELASLDYGGPLTIRRLSVERHLASPRSSSSLYGVDCVAEDQKGLVEAIARHVVYDCMQATAVMSTNAVAFLLLTKFRDGCTLDALAAGIETLTQELLGAHQDVGYSGEPIDIVNHAINILGPGLVLKERDSGNTIVKAVSILPNIIELSYYGNCLLPFYAMQSIVATAFMSILDGDFNRAVMHTELMDTTLELCELMSQEFILCKPCQELDDLITQAISCLIVKGLFGDINFEVSKSADDAHCKRLNHTVLPDMFEGPDIMRVPIYKLKNGSEYNGNWHHLQAVLRPLIEVYGVTILSLPRLLASENGFTRISEPEFVQDILQEMKRLLYSGDCKYGESLSTDAIKNCIKLLRIWGIIDLRTEGRLRLLSISKNYDSVSKLKTVYNLVVKFKTELPAEIQQCNR